MIDGSSKLKLLSIPESDDVLVPVRYGDKTPKFLLARVVGVVWLFVGIIVMAYLSAIMTTSLTFGTLTDYTDVMNKEVGDSIEKASPFRPN